MSEGWIKLHRKILENDTFRDPAVFMVFVQLLLKATHKPYRIDRKGREIFLEPGQLLLSVRPFAEALKMGRQQIRRVLGLLENRVTIKTKTNPLGTIVTICNWEKYQVEEKPCNPAPTQQPTQHQPSTNPHNKKEKNEKKEDSPLLPSVVVPPEGDQPKAKPRKKSWPKDFKLTDRMREIAEKHVPGVDADADFHRFENHHRAKGSMFVSWERAWVTWCTSGFQKPMKSKGSNHDDKRRGYLASNTELAERLIRNSQFGKSDRAFAPVDGVSPGDQPDRETGSRHGDRGDGRDLLEVPDWFDQDGGD